MCWILGEYAYLMGADVIAEVCDQICEIAERITSTNSATRAYAITAVIKFIQFRFTTKMLRIYGII
jgi:hypothetical protein